MAIHAIVFIASHNGQAMTTKEIARTLKVSENHLSKVLQRLAKAGLIESVRGPGGGYELGGRGEEITLLEVYEAIDGAIPEQGCLLDPGRCIGRQCIMGGILTRLNGEIRSYLGHARIAELTAAFETKGEIK